MALQACRECQGQVSTEAPSCPHCGVPHPAPQIELERGICVGCGEEIRVDPSGECPHCGVIEPFDQAPVIISESKSDGANASRNLRGPDYTAGCLGLLLGPVGLWYKGKWPAGFAWLAMTVVLGIATGFLLVPILWIGMAIHALIAEPEA